MALANESRTIITTTIDAKGAQTARVNIKELGLEDHIDCRLEDLRREFPYDKNSFDFIYARLVLHYLSAPDLDLTLKNFRYALKPGGKLFIVVRSAKNIEGKNIPVDPVTKFTQEDILAMGPRYLHTPESIINHLGQAGFEIDYLNEFQEQLYFDFMRTQPDPVKHHVIELLAR